MGRLLALVLVFGFGAISLAEDDKLSEDEQAIVDLTNKEREKKKLPAFKVNATLMKAARMHAANMAKQNKLEHALDGKRIGDRLKDLGYNGASWGENISGRENAASAVNGWMNSQGHRANILKAEFTEIGVGMAQNQGKPYIALAFDKSKQKK